MGETFGQKPSAGNCNLSDAIDLGGTDRATPTFRRRPERCIRAKLDTPFVGGTGAFI